MVYQKLLGSLELDTVLLCLVGPFIHFTPNFRPRTNLFCIALMISDEGELLDKMPLVMRTAIATDINLATFQKIDLFKVQAK